MLKKLRQQVSFRLLQAQKKIDMLATRERSLLLIVGLGIIFFIIRNTFIVPLELSYSELKVTSEATEVKLEKATEVLDKAKTDLTHDPNAELREKIRVLKAANPTLNSEINKLSSNLLLPKEMSEILRQVLSEAGGLTLIGLESLPTERLVMQQKISEKDKKDKKEVAPSVYRHGFKMTFEGGYFDTLYYLERLEMLPQQLIWKDLQYTVKTFPVATVVLTVYTLSDAAEWIGV